MRLSLHFKWASLASECGALTLKQWFHVVRGPLRFTRDWRQTNKCSVIYFRSSVEKCAQSENFFELMIWIWITSIEKARRKWKVVDNVSITATWFVFVLMGVLDLFVFGVPLLIEHVGQTIALRYLWFHPFQDIDYILQPSRKPAFRNPTENLPYWLLVPFNFPGYKKETNKQSLETPARARFFIHFNQPNRLFQQQTTWR